MEKKMILIVNDDPDTDELLTSLFRKTGYYPVVIQKGQDAIHLSQKRKPDLVIFKAQLFGLGGWQKYEKMLDEDHIPTICLSTQPCEEIENRISNEGISDCLDKPIFDEKFLARVQVLVNHPRFIETIPMNTRGYPFLQRPTVTVVIPTLNEAENIPLVLPWLPCEWIDEVILVDGRSTDGTVEIARRIMPSIKVVLEQKRGKGAALQSGYRAATSDIIIVLDADGSNDPREIPRFVNALMEGSDFVKGSRFAIGGGTTDMPRFRQMGNGIFVALTNLLFRAKFTDLCYGYHAFWKYCLDSLDLSSAEGFEIDTVLYLGALHEQLRITEVPSFEGYRFNGVGKLRTFPDGYRVLMTIARSGWQHLKTSSKTNYMGFRGNINGYIDPPSNSQLSNTSMQIQSQSDR